jgi:hypothetical protein
MGALTRTLVPGGCGSAQLTLTRSSGYSPHRASAYIGNDGIEKVSRLPVQLYREDPDVAHCV